MCTDLYDMGLYLSQGSCVALDGARLHCSFGIGAEISQLLVQNLVAISAAFKAKLVRLLLTLASVCKSSALILFTQNSSL